MCTYRERKAEIHSQEMIRLQKLGYPMPVEAGVNPPRRMFPAHTTSVSRGEGAWINFWAHPTVYELVERYGTCPYPSLRVEFVHGGEDVMAKPEDALDQVESLRRKFPNIDIRWHIRPGEGHAADCDEEYSYYAEFFAS